MSAEELRESLPILPDTDPEEAARIRALIAVGSPDDQALAAAYEADAAALAAVSRLHAGDHPALCGFADKVMACIAAEPREERRRDPVPGPVALAPMLRPTFGLQLWVALAAMLLGGLGLAILAFDTPAQPPVVVASEDLPRELPAPLPSRAGSPIQALPVSSPAGPLPAPSLLQRPHRSGFSGGRRAPRGPIVPVDGRGARGEDPLADVLRRMWQVRDLKRVPPKREGEREVKF
ncbi:MAG: hypothetical protein AB7N76_14700 [Planctomycetota bacterium]